MIPFHNSRFTSVRFTDTNLKKMKKKEGSLVKQEICIRWGIRSQGVSCYKWAKSEHWNNNVLKTEWKHASTKNKASKLHLETQNDIVTIFTQSIMCVCLSEVRSWWQQAEQSIFRCPSPKLHFLVPPGGSRGIPRPDELYNSSGSTLSNSHN